METRREREVRVNDKDGDRVNDRKLPFPLHDDISATGSRIEPNEKGFQRGRIRASNELSFIDRKSISSELQRFKVSGILIRFNRRFEVNNEIKIVLYTRIFREPEVVSK